MSEVQRYYVGEYGLVEGEALGRLSVVLATDFDRVTAERDALQARLTAADERADEDDMVLRSSVPERHKGCTSPVGAVQSYIAELEGRADLLEALLRDARQYHGVTLLTDPPQDAWKYHRISERIEAALKPAEAAKCARCECSTVESCDERGCGFLGSGNGAP